jgi:hypothetical protein
MKLLRIAHSQNGGFRQDSKAAKGMGLGRKRTRENAWTQIDARPQSPEF